MYANILVPLDGSARAERILPYVEEIAVKFGSRITLLQIIESGMTIVTETKRAVSEARAYLAGMEGSFRSKHIDVRSLVESGPVVMTINDVAAREACDLIAMASHGRTGLNRVFYGSVAAGVLHRADRPLLLVRAQNGY